MGHLPYDLAIKTTAWIIVMIYLVIIATLLIIKLLKLEEKSQKAMHRAYGLFLYLYPVARLFFIFSDYERDANAETLLYYRFVAIAYIFLIIGFLNIIFLAEKYIIKRSKYIITSSIPIVLAINVFIIFNPNLMPIVRYINYALLYFEVGLLLIIYLYLAIKTSGKLRTESLLIVSALLIMVIASILDSDALISSGLILPYYSPILIGFGATIFAYAQLKK